MTQEDKDFLPTTANNPGEQRDVLNLGMISSLSLEDLNPDEKAAIRKEQAHAMIAAQEKMANVAVGVKALDASLSSLAANVSNMTADGISATVTNTREDALGRTEVIIGNTDTARSGKLSRTQRGLKDNTAVWMVFALATLAIIAFVVTKLYGS
jgi:K+-transporting ATPase c subunit